MNRNQIKISSLTAIAIAILFNLVIITKGLTADPVDYMLFDIEMTNPADFDRNLMETMQHLDNAAGSHVNTGVVTFHLPNGDKVKTIMSVDDVRKVLSGELRYSDFIGDRITVL